jgi:hypothetical protein
LNRIQTGFVKATHRTVRARGVEAKLARQITHGKRLA